VLKNFRFKFLSGELNLILGLFIVFISTIRTSSSIPSPHLSNNFKSRKDGKEPFDKKPKTYYEKSHLFQNT
jgi:hypothetical protein